MHNNRFCKLHNTLDNFSYIMKYCLCDYVVILTHYRSVIKRLTDSTYEYYEWIYGY